MWRHRPPSARSIRRAWLTDVIAAIWEQSRRTYGWRRIQAELADYHGAVVNHKLVRSIMREHGMHGLPAHRTRRKPAGRHLATTVDLVNRQFTRDGPNLLWMTDIAEHPTIEGRVFCCAVLDAWSRKIVGWSIDRRPTAAMVNQALGMAIDQRAATPATTIHSDHGSQFTSWTFGRRVKDAGLAQSFGSIGSGYDNAMVESLWARMQVELLNRQRWRTRLELSTAMFRLDRGLLQSNPPSFSPRQHLTRRVRTPPHPPSHRRLTRTRRVHQHGPTPGRYAGSG